MCVILEVVLGERDGRSWGAGGVRGGICEGVCVCVCVIKLDIHVHMYMYVCI